MSKILYGIFCMTLFSCSLMENKHNKGSFAYDLDFLCGKDSVIILTSGESKIIVSPKYQGKVFTSTSDGENSFGWIHYSAFEGPLDPHMNAYGGENRLWLGPEGGKFSLFFAQDSKMEFQNWKTPSAFDSEPWEVKTKTANMVSMKKDMQLVNYAGTKLSLSVARNISILERSEIDALLNIKMESDIKAVGYETANTLTNTGNFAWNDTTGMPCLWLLDMLKPSDHTTVVIPHRANAKPATTDYFGEIAGDRIAYQNNVLFFKADGKSRGKLGIHPGAAENVAGSYDTEKKILTITMFDISNGSYLNQEWNTTKDPLTGDAVNAYNDGPLADGKQMGPFYEIESVSPAAFLQPRESLTHNHSVFHFTGSEESLNMITMKVLGVSIDQIKTALK
ncbi:MAG: DUF6786 family protein [Bacteroidota bacterium]